MWAKIKDKLTSWVHRGLSGIYNTFFDQVQGLSLLLILLLIAIGILVIGFYRGVIDPEARDFFLRVLEVLGSILLVFVYLLMILRDRREREEEKEAAIMRDLVDEVFQPMIEALLENKNKTRSGDINWFSSNPIDELNGVIVDLNADPSEIERFERNYQDLHNLANKHDHQTTNIIERGLSIRRQIHGPIKGYIDQEGITTPKGEVADEQIVINSIINRTLPPLDGDHSMIYTSHISDFSDIVDDKIGEEFEEFKQIEEEYLETINHLLERLREERDRIRRKYGLSISS